MCSNNNKHLIWENTISKSFRKSGWKASGTGLFRGGSWGRVQGVRTPLPPEITRGFLMQLVFCKNYVVYWC